MAYHYAHVGWPRTSALLSRSNMGWITISFLLLEISLYNYPATSLFILFYLFIFIAFSTEPFEYVTRFSKRILGLTVVAFAVYYASFKLIYFPLMHDYWGEAFQSYDPGTYRFDLAVNAHLSGFLSDLVHYGLLAWMPENGYFNFPIFNGLVVLIAPILWLCLSSDRDNLEAITSKAKYGLNKLRLLLITALASVAPFLLTPNSFVAYRVETIWFSIVAAMVVGGYLLLFRLINLYSPLKAIFAGVIFVIAVSSATAINVYATVTNSVIELEYFRTKLAELPKITRTKQAEIVVILPPPHSIFVNHPIALDLSYTATNHSGLMYGIIHMVAEELGVSRDKYRFRSQTKLDTFPSADIVIDMREVPKAQLSSRLTASKGPL